MYDVDAVAELCNIKIDCSAFKHYTNYTLFLISMPF